MGLCVNIPSSWRYDQGFADIAFAFGSAGDQPIAGDWDGDGVDTIGVFHSATGAFLLRNSNSAGPADYGFSLGQSGDIAIAGDWNGDGRDTVGVFRPSTGMFYLSNSNDQGFADIAFAYGVSTDQPVAGDWNNDGIDTIGVFRSGTFYLRNSNSGGFADLVFGFGNATGDLPVAGNWDGQPATLPPTATPSPTPNPGSPMNASFTYDGDGKRVKSTLNGATTYFVGNYYEVTGSTITKYYYAGTQRIAMRTNGVLNYLLGDHLGSTSLTTDANGQNLIETRYTAWGEVRYASGNTPTKYQYTGQFSYEADFGLLFYGARWYDSSLGRFNQPDTIIPQSHGVQAWDRYAYTSNNPVKYVDPNGHDCGLSMIFGLFGVSYSCPTSTGNWIEGFDPVHEDIGLEINVPVEEVNNFQGFDPVPEDDGNEGYDPAPQDNGNEGYDPVHEDGLQIDAIDFGDRSDLRENLGLTDPRIDAHHLIPWDLQNHPLVQRGAEAGWHMNEAYNGMPLRNPHAVAGHRNYNDYVADLLDHYYDPEMSAEDADEALMIVVEHMRNLIKTNDPNRIR